MQDAAHCGLQISQALHEYFAKQDQVAQALHEYFAKQDQVAVSLPKVYNFPYLLQLLCPVVTATASCAGADIWR